MASQRSSSSAVATRLSSRTLSKDSRPAAKAATAVARRHALRELGDGLRHVFGNPVLRSQLLCLTAAGVFAHAYEAPLFVFAYGRLHMSPGLLGAIFAAGGAGSIFGSIVAMRVIARVGVGRTMAFTDAVAIGLYAAIPLAVFLPPPRCSSRSSSSSAPSPPRATSPR